MGVELDGFPLQTSLTDNHVMIAKDPSNGQTQRFTWLTIKNTIKSWFSTVATSGNYSDLSGKPSLATVATSGEYNDLVNKPTSVLAVPFVVNNAKTDSNGYADFLQKDSNSQITILAGGSNPNLEMTAYDGSRVILISNIIKTGLSTDGIFVLICNLETSTVDIVLSSTVTEGTVPPSGGSDGDYYVDINPLITYKKVSGVWTPYKFVKLGEFIRTAGVIGTPVSYALNGIAISTFGSITGTRTFNHNLGTNKKLIITEIGSESGSLQQYNLNYYIPTQISCTTYSTRTTVTANISDTPYGASGQMRFICKRMF